MKIKIIKGDITDLAVDAIVNATNEDLLGGSGVCGAIFNKAGLKAMQAECDKIGHCDTGNAVITKGYNLKAKYVIHAVGPIYRKEESEELLRGAYYNSLRVANDNNIRSIAFPSISTGIYGYPLDKACPIAISAIKKFFNDYPNTCINNVIICAYNDYTYNGFIDVYEKEIADFRGVLVSVLDATRSFDFAVRPFYLMYLNGYISSKQLINRLNYFGLYDALDGLSEDNIRNIIESMDDKVEKSLDLNEFPVRIDRAMLDYWKTKLDYPDGCYEPEEMDFDLDLFYYGLPPVCMGMGDYYVFSCNLISKNLYLKGMEILKIY